jgi:hypothetical protein
MYLRDELIFNFDEEGIVSTPMNFELCKRTEESIDRKLSVLIVLWILDKCVMVLLFWAFN